MVAAAQSEWKPTACILCSLNCGLEVQVEGRELKRVRGDEAHPSSKGYLCQKAARLNFYQNHPMRLSEPLRRNDDGTFEPIDWDTAIQEIAAKLVALRDTHGGHSLAYYGGGGQGNHLGGVYSSALRAACQTSYLYTALAQEKTGDFWVNGKLFGKQNCHVTEGMHEADYVIVLGTNPWQAHGVPRARKVLKEIAKDPKRTLVVIDPRETQTAALADHHLPVKPGTDAYLLSAILGTMVQEGWVDSSFLDGRTHGFEEVAAVLRDVPVEAYAQRSGVSLEQVRTVAKGLSQASSACVRADLGIQQSLHSTLNSYLEKLLFLLSGNFAKEGGNNLHTALVPLIGHSKEDKAKVTQVTGMHEISKLFPPNILPQEIDTEHPKRVRGLIIDSVNPAVSAADTQAYAKALKKLELLVVVDVAMTDTARFAHYVLPAATQFEKLESTFFNLEFPTNYYHLRKPVLEKEGNTLPEPEIYSRLVTAMGALPERFPVLERIAKLDRKWPKLRLFPTAFAAALKLHPEWAKYLPVVLYRTLGRALPEGKEAAAVLWGAIHFYVRKYSKQVQRTGLSGSGYALGEALFSRILEADTAVPLSTHTYEEMWSLMRTEDRKAQLAIPELLQQIRELSSFEEPTSEEFPLVLAAGERRSYNANQIYRVPEWRKKDQEGTLRIHPEDAASYGVVDGGAVICESQRGAISVVAALDDGMQRGFVSLPHGYGFDYADSPTSQETSQNGPRINVLTSSEHCDPLTKTPYHKYVPVRLRAE
ncbi:MAG: molybdopterin oxidoreductase family protein [Deltaproteobacteria bacterium]|nr:MAG: molybdopterin oxidoreductase family protein [Deltaproteobacteria bacterium]